MKFSNVLKESKIELIIETTIDQLIDYVKNAEKTSNEIKLNRLKSSSFIRDIKNSTGTLTLGLDDVTRAFKINGIDIENYPAIIQLARQQSVNNSDPKKEEVRRKEVFSNRAENPSRPSWLQSKS